MSKVDAYAATCWELLLVQRCYCAIGRLKVSYSAAALHLMSIATGCTSRHTSHAKIIISGCRQRDRRNLVSGVGNG
jgi:hypothetical protein